MKPTEEELAIFYEHYVKPFIENASDADLLLVAAYAQMVANEREPETFAPQNVLRDNRDV